MKLVFAALLILSLFEIRQHVLIAPADIAELAPLIEILFLAADIDEPVDRARTAQDLAARLDDSAVVELGFGLRLIKPVEFAVAKQLAVSDRDMNPRIAILAARFEQQHAIDARGAQAIGEDTACRAGADNHIIKRAVVAHRPIQAVLLGVATTSRAKNAGWIKRCASP
jgi:hypothetical protein